MHVLFYLVMSFSSFRLLLHLFFEGNSDGCVEEVLVLIWIEVLTKTAHLHQRHSNGGGGGTNIISICIVLLWCVLLLD